MSSGDYDARRRPEEPIAFDIRPCSRDHVCAMGDGPCNGLPRAHGKPPARQVVANINYTPDKAADDAHRQRIIARPSFESILMTFADGLSRRSTCRRLQVGCVIVSPDFRSIYSCGYNGNAAGLPNDCDSTTPGLCGDLHAEENAIIACDVPRSMPKVFITTHSPCVMCAKRIIQLGGVTRVVFRDLYRSADGLEILKRGGIATMQLDGAP